MKITYRLTTLFILISFFQNSFGQKKNGKFFPGQITLNSSESFEGQLSYDEYGKRLYFEKNDSVFTYSARDLKKFSFTKKDQLQEYEILPFPNYINHMVPTIFEVVWEGREVKLLKRWATLTKKKTYTTPDHVQLTQVDPMTGKISNGPTLSIKTKPKTYSYKLPNTSEYLYFVNKENRVKPYLKRKATTRKILDRYLLARLTKSHFKALKQYAEDNKLDFDKEKDLIKILNHYNTLSSAN